ncbi:MAG: IPT/TIG domain-containing protein [Acidobacteria bacterium]|nr:IPT/TIG domain-containing protein [Acidobacteriota bacterium]
MPRTSRFGRLFLFSLMLLMLAYQRPNRAGAVPAGVEHKLWSVYWTVEPGFTSTLEMKNNLVADPLNVSVSLYFANGEEYPLAPVQLGPRQTATIDLNRAIESLPSAVAARAGREGTLELEFVAPSPSALMGSVSVLNPERGIAWNFFLYPLRSGLPITPLRGLFWFLNRAADGFVAMHNVSEEFLSVRPHFHIAGQTYALPPISLAPGQGHKLMLRAELRKLGLADVAGGGVELTYDGVPDALKAHGVLFDNRGFSAEVDFTRFESWEEAQTVTLRTPRFAVGQADVRLGLPGRTLFEPMLALHNFNRHALDVTLLVGYRVGVDNHQQRIPISMSPGDTQILKLHPLLRALIPADVPWASLELSYTDRHTGLATAMVSVSQDGAHSIRSVLNWVRGSIREGWYWRADADHTTLLGILNSDTEEERVAVSLDYSVGGVKRSYELPVMTIKAGSAENLDIGEIISRGEPDADGDVIPATVSFGGYRVRKVNRLQGNLTTEALVINRRKKGFLTFYNTACCLRFPRFDPGQKEGVVGDTFQINITATDTCTYEQVPLDGLHSSNNPYVATVGVFTGQVSMVGVGATSIYSTALYPRLSLEQCMDSVANGYCDVTVTPVIQTITPGRGPIGNTTAVTIAGNGFGTSPSVQAGSGITVNITSASNTQIQANFVVAANSPAGNHAVTVTASGQTSNSVNFFVQIPATFRELSVATSSEVCQPGTAGHYSDVLYQVFDQAGNPIEKAGLTPQEHFTVNGTPAFPGFLPFASPQTTDSLGRLLDTPVGSCFGPPVPAGNPCADVVQSFNVRVPTSSGEITYTIATITTRRDCALGQRIQVSPGGTYTFGTVN